MILFRVWVGVDLAWPGWLCPFRHGEAVPVRALSRGRGERGEEPTDGAATGDDSVPDAVGDSRPWGLFPTGEETANIVTPNVRRALQQRGARARRVAWCRLRNAPASKTDFEAIIQGRKGADPPFVIAVFEGRCSMAVWERIEVELIDARAAACTAL